jgi:hypothetical protein
MSEGPEDRLRRALRVALPPMADGEPARDLWPRVRQRLAAPPAAASRFDWALLAALLIWLAVFPDSLLALLYHL